MKFTSDVDIDFADRNLILDRIEHTAARLRTVDGDRRHQTGVYVTDIPYDPRDDMSSLYYDQAESRGYLKLDLLNVWVYKFVRDEQHLQELMREPQWDRLLDSEYFEKLIHIGRHYHVMKLMPEPINTVPRLAMFLSVIRPGKRHLIGQPWSVVAQTVWQAGADGYQFKQAHSIAYAVLVAVHMNLLVENPMASSLQE